MAKRGVSRHECARALFLALKKWPNGIKAADFRRRNGASDGTVRRAVKLLEARGVLIEYDASSRRLRLKDPSHEDPGLDPSSSDLTLLMLGAALLEPFLDATTRARVRASVGAFGREFGLTGPAKSPDIAVRSSVTMRSTVDPAVLRKILDSLQTGVLRISYNSPWGEHGRHQQHVVEPWGVQLVDGAMYLRAYSRKRKQPRTFHLGFVVACVGLPRSQPEAPVPPNAEIWGSPDAGYGVDEHEPGTATVVFRGPVARWLARIEWHPEQRDKGPGRKDMLERSVPYRSRREFARRLLSYADAIVSIEPADLRDEVANAIDRLGRAIGTTKIDRNP